MRWACNSIGVKEMHTEFWWRNLSQNVHLKYRKGDVTVTFEMDLRRMGE
jgi:hypothetical protein